MNVYINGEKKFAFVARLPSQPAPLLSRPTTPPQPTGLAGTLSHRAFSRPLCTVPVCVPSAPCLFAPLLHRAWSRPYCARCSEPVPCSVLPGSRTACACAGSGC